MGAASSRRCPTPSWVLYLPPQLQAPFPVRCGSRRSRQELTGWRPGRVFGVQGRHPHLRTKDNRGHKFMSKGKSSLLTMEQAGWGLCSPSAWRAGTTRNTQRRLRLLPNAPQASQTAQELSGATGRGLWGSENPPRGVSRRTADSPEPTGQR